NQRVWNHLPPLKVARSHPGIAQIDRRIYVIGGGGPGFHSLRSVEIYDPTLNQWEAGRDMPTARSGVATFEIDGKIYVVGGGFKQANGKFKFL
ncbi:MAG: galactose oxidase, partial [Candidatus Aminicenantes bacterium]|nr:galactose oxidase [Candidatus Aminicenantes bacterium]NIN48100.1 galactose oxidase [Candidatus Aminicenantes bacterium]NIN91001.1 galactose oxidase [Candidatus Aminicenantes bacterium]NIT29626.1 galactose oxidase [Candidatus Aminicenantes bacterium]